MASAAVSVSSARSASRPRPVVGNGLLGSAHRFLVPVLILIVWQALDSLGWINSRLMPSPVMVAEAFWQLLVTGQLLTNLWVSLVRVMVGLGIGVVLGVVFGLFAGLSRFGENTVDSTLQMVRTLPHLALIPLFILWFGIGETPKIALIALGSVFPIYLNLFAGIRAVDRKIIEAASTLDLTRSEIIWNVILPGALPSFLVGLRYAVGIAWLTLVVAEQVNANSGIGYLVMNARDFLETDVIFVGLIIYAILGLTTDQMVRAIERRALVWRPSFVGPQQVNRGIV
ncbi:ABC transporter permease subunit [Acidisoma sp.]|uniref:ABC transporter permease subunit n=1 Tax=Acidisoma sp. TaxID=1872115 RepID=UPI003AFFC269